MRRMGSRDLRRLTRRMGLNINELQGVEEVIIRLPDKEIVIKNPSVSVIEAKGGARIYNVAGEEEERPRGVSEEKEEEGGIEISEEDIQLVAMQAGVSPEEAERALREAGGDLAKAIMLLSSRG